MLDPEKTRERTMLLARVQVRIFLDRPGYECLRKHLAQGSRSQAVVDKAVLLGNTRVVECTATQANDLLRDVKSDCPNAVSRIIEGIRAVGLTPQDH